MAGELVTKFGHLPLAKEHVGCLIDFCVLLYGL